jgi:Flp pilus assembly protein protease CpaA
MNWKIYFDFLNYIIIFLFLFYCVIKDLKTRKIPNKLIKNILTLSILLNLLKIVTLSNFNIIIVFSKLILISSVFLMNYLLYKIKIIGGGDFKVIILIFILCPQFLISFRFIFLFFLIFNSIFLLKKFFLMIFNYLTHSKELFYVFFNINRSYSRLKKIYFLLFYKFLDYNNINSSELSKYNLYSTNLIFNHKKGTFQVLVNLRSTLMIDISVGFCLTFLIAI